MPQKRPGQAWCNHARQLSCPWACLHECLGANFGYKHQHTHQHTPTSAEKLDVSRLNEYIMHTQLFLAFLSSYKRGANFYSSRFPDFCYWLRAMPWFSSFFTVYHVLSQNLVFQVAGENLDVQGHAKGEEEVVKPGTICIWGYRPPLAVIQCVATPPPPTPLPTKMLVVGLVKRSSACSTWC